MGFILTLEINLDLSDLSCQDIHIFRTERRKNTHLEGLLN